VVTSLIDKPHTWDVFLPHVWFSIRNRDNRNTGLLKNYVWLGYIKAPGACKLELAKESPDVVKNGLELSGADLNPSIEIKDSSVELDDAPLVKEGYLVVSSP